MGYLSVNQMTVISFYCQLNFPHYFRWFFFSRFFPSFVCFTMKSNWFEQKDFINNLKNRRDRITNSTDSSPNIAQLLYAFLSVEQDWKIPCESRHLDYSRMDKKTLYYPTSVKSFLQEGVAIQRLEILVRTKDSLCSKSKRVQWKFGI